MTSKETLKSKIEQALRRMQRNDRHLLEGEVNERSLTHMLAVYLRLKFPRYHVDCEYNRMFKAGRQVAKKTVYLSGVDSSVSTADLEAKTVYPDVIVHRREDDRHNLLVIEAKKSGRDPSEDYRKLNSFMRLKSDDGLGYKFSAFVIFDLSGSSVNVKSSEEKW